MRIIGFNPQVMRKCTCYHCSAIIEYSPSDVQDTNRTDEGTRIRGFDCPNCNEFVRVNH